MCLRPNYNFNDQKEWYKLVVDIMEAHCKPNENMVDIRKSRWVENLLKKCREDVAYTSNSHPSSGYDQIISLEEKVNYVSLILCITTMLCSVF